MSELYHFNDCGLETPVTTRKRTHASVTNLRSQKRRRSSVTSFDLGREIGVDALSVNENHNETSSADRFVSKRPKNFLPLNITPRTRRISRQFGLIDERVLNFRDDTEILPSSTSTFTDENTMTLLRRSASSLFLSPPALRLSSVTENLNKRRQSVLTLDSPGISSDPDAFPISWSLNNYIAVACGRDVFYQNLDNKTVSHLGHSGLVGGLNVIEWAGKKCPNYLAAGNSQGWVQVWDATGNSGVPTRAIHAWFKGEDLAIKSISWNDDVMAVGADEGTISLVDIRTPDEVVKIPQHRDAVLGLKWSTDGTFLASGDRHGLVYIWDKRAGKSLVDVSPTKIRNKGSARALAWCPWKPDLLATGSSSPDGKIRIWSTSSISGRNPEPLHTISLSTSINSLHWSPHCKELLSTQGSSFVHVPPPRSSRRNNTSQTSLPFTTVQTALTNSITVHEYPSCKRLLTLTQAHASAVTHSCVSPNGEHVFTVCPKEEAIKMWQVWAERPSFRKKEDAFSKFTIR